MADKEKDSGKADKAERAAKVKVDRSPEAAARAEKAEAAKARAAKKGAPAEKKPREPEERVTPRLRTHFDQVIRKAMTEQFGYKNPMQVPRVTKIVLNMGIGEGVADRKKVEQAAEAMAAIAGQKPVITKSRKSIANYKLRDGQAIDMMSLAMVIPLPATDMWECLNIRQKMKILLSAVPKDDPEAAAIREIEQRVTAAYPDLEKTRYQEEPEQRLRVARFRR